MAKRKKDSWLNVPWGVRRIFLSPILRLILKFKPRRSKQHAKCNRWCRSDNMRRLITLLDFSHVGLKQFLTVYLVSTVFSEACWLLEDWSPIAFKEIHVDRMVSIFHLCASDIPIGTIFTENEYMLTAPDIRTQI